jgi:hypothetical protein
VNLPFGVLGSRVFPDISRKEACGGWISKPELEDQLVIRADGVASFPDSSRFVRDVNLELGRLRTLQAA